MENLIETLCKQRDAYEQAAAQCLANYHANRGAQEATEKALALFRDRLELLDPTTDKEKE